MLQVADFIRVNMPKGGIEPPTRGFSVHCSTQLGYRKELMFTVTYEIL